MERVVQVQDGHDVDCAASKSMVPSVELARHSFPPVFAALRSV